MNTPEHTRNPNEENINGQIVIELGRYIKEELDTFRNELKVEKLNA